MSRAMWRGMAAGVLALASVAPMAAAQDQAKGPSDADLIARVSRSVVVVEHTYRYDRGEAPELDVAGRQEQRVSAELEHADFERHARSRRRLLEDHAQGLPFE